jgi:protein-tyrosine phosphatase
VNGIYWIYGSAEERLAPPKSAFGLRTPMPLAVVLCPRGGRYLKRELMHLRSAGVDTVVSLLSVEQVEMLDLEEEPALAAKLGIEFLHHPIPDHQLPQDEERFRAFVADLARRMQEGARIGIHCWGSIGRAPMTAACTLIDLGWPADQALLAIEMARGCSVPDTEEQLRWVLNFGKTA